MMRHSTPVATRDFGPTSIPSPTCWRTSADTVIEGIQSNATPAAMTGLKRCVAILARSAAGAELYGRSTVSALKLDVSARNNPMADRDTIFVVSHLNVLMTF